MTTDAYAPDPRLVGALATATEGAAQSLPQPLPQSLPLARLIAQATSDAMFALAAGAPLDALEAVAKRRGEAYVAVLSGQPIHTMLESFDGWNVEMTRALAPIAPPVGLPMADVLAEKVTLEAGARGLRGLFSSKPSDKDIQRVKRIGTLATRAVRAVASADGPLDAEESRTIAAFISALGLPDADAHALHAEAPIPVQHLEIYGDLETSVVKAIMRGAWLAAAWDAIDPREEDVVRGIGQKLNLPLNEIEVLRNEAVARVDARRAAGLAAVEIARYMLSDRVPGLGVQLAVQVGTMMLPRRYRDEALAHVGHWTRVQLSGRHRDLHGEQKQLILSIGWLLALFEDPPVSRRAILRARHDRFAQDLGEDGARIRGALDQWLSELLAPAAFPLSADPR